MARFIIEVPDHMAHIVTDDDAIISTGAVYPECDTREITNFDIVGRIDDREEIARLEKRIDAMLEWANKIEARVDGIAETNNLWDGS